MIRFDCSCYHDISHYSNDAADDDNHNDDMNNADVNDEDNLS